MSEDEHTLNIASDSNKIVRDSVEHGPITLSDSISTLPAEVIVEGQQMQKVCIRITHKPVTSSRVLSPVSRRSKSSSRSLRCSDNALDLPFPQEVTGSSSESSELNAVGCNVFPTEFYVSSAVSDCSDACQPAVDQDAIIIKKAKNLIRKGVDCIEKHYHFVNVGLKRDLSVVQLELTKIQQHLDEEVMLRTKNESELINLKSQMKEKDDEIERLRHKEVEDFKNRKLIEEELAKLKNELQKVRMSPDVAQLKSDLNATKLQLSEALKEYEQLKTQTSKTVFCIPSNGTGRFVTRLPGTMLRALHDEQEGETSEVSIQRINEATLPTLRSEKSALGAFNLPLTSRRGLIGVHNANDSYARSPGHPIKLPMIEFGQKFSQRTPQSVLTPQESA